MKGQSRTGQDRTGQDSIMKLYDWYRDYCNVKLGVANGCIWHIAEVNMGRVCQKSGYTLSSVSNYYLFN